jgi:hypothetical protein
VPARKAFRGAYKWERERRNKADIKERERGEATTQK